MDRGYHAERSAIWFRVVITHVDSEEVTVITLTQITMNTLRQSKAVVRI